MEFTLACILLTGLGVAVAFPSGAPSSACADLLPQHGVPPSTNTSPYTINLNQTTYFSNQPITVTISTSDATMYPITGFLLQGRLAGMKSNTSVGMFANPSGSTKLLMCDKNGDSFTHSSAISRTTVQITWYPPSNDVGIVCVIGTVAKSKEEFYGILRSKQIRYSQVSQITTSAPGQGGAGKGGTGSGMTTSTLTVILVFVIAAMTTFFS